MSVYTQPQIAKCNKMSTIKTEECENKTKIMNTDINGIQNDFVKNECHEQISNNELIICNEHKTFSKRPYHVSASGANINKSWYARCNRWRSQSCDRKSRNGSLRYSWIDYKNGIE